MAAITNPTREQRYISALAPVFNSSMPKELLHLIASYMSPDFTDSNHRKRVYTRAINTLDFGLNDINYYFYGFNPTTRRGEIIHFNSHTFGGGILTVHAIASENGASVEPQRFYSGPILGWPESNLIGIRHTGDSFRFSFEDRPKHWQTHVLSLTGEMDSGGHLLNSGGPTTSVAVELEDGVLYRNTEKLEFRTPYPIEETHFRPHVSFLSGDFFFVGGINIEDKIPFCAVYSKTQSTGRITWLRSEENDKINMAAGTWNMISLFANDEVVAMSWVLLDNRAACTLWRMHSWEQINRLTTDNKGNSRLCVAIENGTVALASENAKTTFIEYFDF